MDHPKSMSHHGVRRVVDISTRGLRGRAKFDHLREACRQAIVGYDVAVESDIDYEAQFHGLAQKDLCILKIESMPCRVVRILDQPRNVFSDSLVLIFALSGRLLAEQDGRSTLLGPGEGALLVADRGYWLRAEDPHSVLKFRFPRTLLSRPSDLLQHTARNFFEAPGISRLFFNFANDFSRHAHAMSPLQASKVAQTLVRMLETVIGGFSDQQEWGLSQQRAATLRRVKSLIQENLGDENLRSAWVSDRLQLSIRYLNKLFENEGTSLGRYIWDQRLESAAADLADRMQNGVPISSVAFKHGFKNLSHFSSAFRTRYQTSPREYRSEAARRYAFPDAAAGEAKE